MRPVNLLPADQRSKSLKVKPTKRGLAGVGMVAAFAAVGYWGFSIHQSIGDAQRELDEARSEQTQLQAQVGAYSAAQARMAAHEQQKGLVVGLAGARVNWERVIRDAATVMPRQTWLTTLTGQSPGLAAAATAAATPASAAPAAGAGGAAVATADATNGLNLDGYAYNHRQVALLMARLGTVPGLGEPKLTSSSVEPRGGRRVVKFQVAVPVDQRSQDRATLEASTVPTSTTSQP